MDDETREAFVQLRADLKTGVGSLTADVKNLTGEVIGLKADVAADRAENRIEFARIDRFFALNHVEHVKTREDMDRRFARVETELSGVTAEVAAFRNEFQRFRDWTTSQISEIRSAIMRLTRRLEKMSG